MDMTPVVNLSRADEFGWRMLAAETMFHSRALAKVSKKQSPEWQLVPKPFCLLMPSAQMFCF